MKPKYFSNKSIVEKAILVGVHAKSERINRLNEYLDELEALATTAGAITCARLTQNLDFPDPRTYLGEGKLNELHTLVG